VTIGHQGAVQDDDRAKNVSISKKSRAPCRVIIADYIVPTIRYTFFILYYLHRNSIFFIAPLILRNVSEEQFRVVILYFAGPDKSRSVLIMYYTQIVLYAMCCVNIPTHYIGRYYYYCCSSGSSDNRRPEFTNEYLPPIPGKTYFQPLS